MHKQYQKAMKIARMGLWEWDVVTNETKWSDEKFRLFDYEPNEFELTFENAFKTVLEEDKAFIFNTLNEKLPTEDFFDYEYRGVKKGGEIIHIWVRVNVDRNEVGEPMRVYGISQDITHRKKLEKEISELNKNLEQQVSIRTNQLEKKNKEVELLLKEMHHRVKNNLQVVSSILNLQQSFISDKKSIETLDQCVKRIKSIAIIHDSFYSNDNLSEIALSDYISKLFDMYVDTERIYLVVEVPDIVLSIEKMLPIGLIVNELLSNTIKHAFPFGSGGEINFKIIKNGSFTMLYEDNGKGMKQDKNKDKATFGIELIETLCDDLEAEYKFITDKEKGMAFVMKTQLV